MSLNPAMVFESFTFSNMLNKYILVKKCKTILVVMYFYQHWYRQVSHTTLIKIYCLHESFLMLKCLHTLKDIRRLVLQKMSDLTSRHTQWFFSDRFRVISVAPPRAFSAELGKTLRMYHDIILYMYKTELLPINFDIG